MWRAVSFSRRKASVTINPPKEWRVIRFGAPQGQGQDDVVEGRKANFLAPCVPPINLADQRGWDGWVDEECSPKRGSITVCDGSDDHVRCALSRNLVTSV